MCVFFIHRVEELGWPLSCEHTSITQEMAVLLEMLSIVACVGAIVRSYFVYHVSCIKDHA